MSQNPNQHGSKRVEFSSTSLETIYGDAAMPAESPSPPQQTWDTETDHILSYFLSGDGAHHLPVATATTDFETTGSGRTTEQQGDRNADQGSSWMMPPPTPNVQFYSHATKPNRPSPLSSHQSDTQPLAGSTSQSSSSSSLSSMAATLVSGVVNPNMLPEQQRFHSMFAALNHNNNAESPISPAAMIGNAQENLLLPQSEQHLPSATREPYHQGHATTSNTTMGPPEPRPANWPQPSVQYAHGAYRMNPQLLYTVATLNRPTVPESAEKRAKRLERNRVSARKSRRKKKERLETLGAQVNDLHIELEGERRKQIECMVPMFEQMKVQMTAETMNTIVQLTEPNNFLHRAILDFQYTQLKTLTMAPYQRFLMWLLLQAPTYFRAAKETQNKPLQKISSKQIGEQQLSTQSKTKIHDPLTAWPLFCFELKFSVDQEDRFVTALTSRDKDTTKADRIQMAIDTTDRLSKAVGGLSHLVAKRQRQSILTFEQRQTLRQYALDRRASASQQPPIAMDLSDICRSLESVLRISTGEEVGR